MKKILIGLVGIVLACVIYNLDAITGQWKFEKLCREQGGTRFLSRVERNAAWEVEGRDTYDYQGPFYFGDIAFVRYQNQAGEKFDVVSDGNINSNNRKYSFLPVIESHATKYRLRRVSENFIDDQRFIKTKYEVIDLVTNSIVASHTQFGYSWTKPERVLLSAPTGVGCWNSQSDINYFYHNIYSNGINK
jgi:hypothetical protein